MSAPRKPGEIGVGVLGYAFMGKAHSNGYIEMPIIFHPPPARPRLVAISGRTEEAVAEAASRYGYQRHSTEWRDVVGDPEVELVDVCLPNDLHHDAAIAAAESGKHVFCEKPLGMNRREAKEMHEAVSRAGVKNMVSYNYRFVPAVMLAKMLIEEGHIGRILQFRAVYLQDWIMDPGFPLVWRLSSGRAGSGALGDLGSHSIDLARYLVGDVRSVCAMKETFIEERPLVEDPTKRGRVDVDDAFISLLRFQNGAIGSVEASRFCAGRKNFQRIEVHGTEGSILFDLERLNELKVYSKRDRADAMGFRDVLVTEGVHPLLKNWWPPGHMLGWEDTHVNGIYHLVDSIANDRDVAPLGATFYDGFRCDEVCEAISTSAREEKWVNLPL
ncbi:MAG: Gfo/Idh/MocA family oxidoreductase [Nitrososphaerales archaeon]